MKILSLQLEEGEELIVEFKGLWRTQAVIIKFTETSVKVIYGTRVVFENKLSQKG